MNARRLVPISTKETTASGANEFGKDFYTAPQLHARVQSTTFQQYDGYKVENLFTDDDSMWLGTEFRIDFEKEEPVSGFMLRNTHVKLLSAFNAKLPAGFNKKKFATSGTIKYSIQCTSTPDDPDSWLDAVDQVLGGTKLAGGTLLSAPELVAVPSLVKRMRSIKFTVNTSSGEVGGLASFRPFTGDFDGGKTFRLQAKKVERQAGKLYFDEIAFEDEYRPLIEKATELWKEEEHRLKTETNTNAANVNLTLGNYARNLKNDLKTMHRLVQQQRRRTSQHQDGESPLVLVERSMAEVAAPILAEQARGAAAENKQRVYALEVLDELKRTARNKKEAERKSGRKLGGASDKIPFCDEDFPLEHRPLVHAARESWVAAEGVLKGAAIIGTVEAEDYAAANDMVIRPVEDEEPLRVRLAKLPTGAGEMYKRLCEELPVFGTTKEGGVVVPELRHNAFLRGFAAVLKHVSNELTAEARVAAKERQEMLATDALRAFKEVLAARYDGAGKVKPTAQVVKDEEQDDQAEFMAFDTTPQTTTAGEAPPDSPTGAGTGEDGALGGTISDGTGLGAGV